MTTPQSPLTSKNILVTGGTGSFGHAFVKRALADNARRIVVFSRDELKQSHMADEFPDPRLRFFIGDVRNPDRLNLAMHGIDYVVHAAAMKRIEVCERDPQEAVATNIIGTSNVAMAAIESGVERAVFLSTDKAPNAHTLYGMTKAVAERLWCDANVYAAGTQTKLSATRYGNVLSSRGSVVGTWRAQTATGRPITITNESMTRFWMRLGDAVDLVCLALDEMRGGEIFVPKIKSAMISTLAQAVAPPDYPIHTIDTRPGERMHETLISAEESRTTYDAGGHYIIEPESRTWGDVGPLPYPRVVEPFSYRSDTNSDQASANELREMLAA